MEPIRRLSLLPALLFVLTYRVNGDYPPSNGALPWTKLTPDQIQHFRYISRADDAALPAGNRAKRAIPGHHIDTYTEQNAAARHNCPSIEAIWFQGQCETCYAVQAMAVYTDRRCIASGGKSNKFYSASQAAACTYAPDPDHPDPVSICKNTGFSHEVFEMVVKRGVPTGGRFDLDGCRPYGVADVKPKPGDPITAWPVVQDLICEAKCRDGTMAARDTSSGHRAWIERLALYDSGPQKGTAPKPDLDKMVQFIKDEVYEEGAVVAVIRIYADILTWDYAKKGPYVKAFPTTDPLIGLHSMRIVGWNKWTDAAGRETPYWIAANSWGAAYHNKGFAWIKMGENTVGIEEAVSGIRVYYKNPFILQSDCTSADFATTALILGCSS